MIEQMETDRNGASAADVATVIAVPTFRRAELLTALIESLAPELAGREAMLIVGDNDCDPAIRALVEGHAGRMRVHYRPVPNRGVAQVRNALVTAATELAPNWRWLLMLDDDGTVTPGWLDRIVCCGERFGAQLVGGPVEGVLPPGAGALARNSIFARRRRWATGPVEMLNTTQNLAIARSLLDQVSLPLFNSRYGASGGEDYDLFRRTARAGGRLIWCDEAVVIEPAPPERLTTLALLHRYYSTGVYMTPIDRSYDGWLVGLKVAIGCLLSGMGKALAGAVIGKEDRTASGVLLMAHGLGRLSGIVGARSARYVSPEDGR